MKHYLIWMGGAAALGALVALVVGQLWAAEGSGAVLGGVIGGAFGGAAGGSYGARVRARTAVGE